MICKHILKGFKKLRVKIKPKKFKLWLDGLGKAMSKKYVEKYWPREPYIISLLACTPIPLLLCSFGLKENPVYLAHVIHVPYSDMIFIHGKISKNIATEVN